MLDENLDRLVQQYLCQLQEYKSMHDIAQKKNLHCQKSSFQTEKDLEELNLLLAERHRAMERIEESQGEIEQIKKDLEKAGLEEITLGALSARGASPKKMEKLEELIGELQSLLKEITLLDNKSQELLEEKLGGIKSKMEGVKVGRKASQAYNNAGTQMEGFFIDRRKG